MTATGTAAEQTRTVLITGSTSGIGAATARALAAQGWLVVVTGRDKSRGAAVVADIEAGGGQAVFVPADLTSLPDALRDFARAATEAAGGRLDAVVHNAALCPAVDTVQLTDTDLAATLAVNIRAPHVLTAALAPAMAERGHGAIVVIGSWMAHVGHPFVGLYSDRHGPIWMLRRRRTAGTTIATTARTTRTPAPTGHHRHGDPARAGPSRFAAGAACAEADWAARARTPTVTVLVYGAGARTVTCQLPGARTGPEA